MLCKQAEGDHVVRLTAAHRLSQQKCTGLVAVILQSCESFLEQRFHSAGDEVLFKELVAVNLTFQKIG